jgi:hypothetical protein
LPDDLEMRALLLATASAGFNRVAFASNWLCYFVPMADRFAIEAELRDLDRFFSPANGQPALAPGAKDQACANLRHALSMLGLPIAFGDIYDDDTYEAVRQFQKTNGHRHCDGICGEGTRHLLIQVLLKSQARGFFQRAPDPQQRSLGHVFLSYSSKDTKLVCEYEKLILEWGFTPWRDKSSIPGGASWNEEIQAKISGSYLLLAFVTRPFLRSHMCKEEIQAAIARNKSILLVQWTTVPRDSWLDQVVQSKQWIAKPPKDIRSPGAVDFRRQLRRSILEAQRRGRNPVQSTFS